MRTEPGRRVVCAVCGRTKKPIGRDSRDNGLCDHECEGYRQPPEPDYLWPGEPAPDAGAAP